MQTWSDDDDDKAEEVSITFLAESLKKTPRTSWTEEEAEDPEKMVGSKIARDFGNRGIYLGEVIRIEYDSEDEDKVRLKNNSTPYSMPHSPLTYALITNYRSSQFF